MKLIIGKEYEVTGIGFVKLIAIEGSSVVVRTRMDSQCTVDAGDLREKNWTWGPDNPPPSTHAPQARGIVAKRIAKLKCVVFITENPDVKRFFRIVPRNPGKRPTRKTPKAVHPATTGMNTLAKALKELR